MLHDQERWPAMATSPFRFMLEISGSFRFRIEALDVILRRQLTRKDHLEGNGPVQGLDLKTGATKSVGGYPEIDRSFVQAYILDGGGTLHEHHCARKVKEVLTDDAVSNVRDPFDGRVASGNPKPPYTGCRSATEDEEDNNKRE